jgi:hypothetical protein
MEQIFYETAIYKINQKDKTLSRIPIKNFRCEKLPKKFTIQEMINLLVNMQKVCFKDNNENNENIDRLINTFMDKSDKTGAVALSLGYKSKEDSFLEYVDGASATLQKTNNGVLPYQQPTINEVCRQKVQKLDSLGTPTHYIMDILEQYVARYMMHTSKKVDGLYLYIEKKPQHGSGEFLLKYYNTKFGFQEMHEHEDDDYYYMKKPLKMIPKIRKSIKKKDNSVNKASTRKLKK